LQAFVALSGFEVGPTLRHTTTGAKCHKAAWGLSNRYGDAVGNMCFAVTRPTELALTLETSSADTNMDAFAVMVLQILLKIVCG
jgi:hypothetical protein